ncbi:MAG: ElyC/SanA/YdcF family protein [Patescibacteria group bacterium]
MSDKRKITIAIMCYGLYGHQYRSSTEMIGLTKYLCDCADYVMSLQTKGMLSGVVFCGGFTNPDIPVESEAGTTAEYFQRLLRERGVYTSIFPILLEEASHNTAQNIVFTGYLMGHRNPFTAEEYCKAIDDVGIRKVDTMRATKKRWHELSHNVVFVCDRYRHAKVWVMLRYAKSLLPNDFRLRVISFPRKDTHPNSSWGIQIAAALRYLFCPSMFFKDLDVGEND